MKIEYRNNHFVMDNEFNKYKESIKKYNKEQLYQEMQRLYNNDLTTMDKLGPGSKEHVEVFIKISEKMCLKTGNGNKLYGKPELVKNIVMYANIYNEDLKFEIECVSTGDTITLQGYKLVCYSIWFFKNTVENIYTEDFKYVENPSTLLNQYKNDSIEYYDVLSEFIDNSIASYENDILSQNPKASNLNIHIKISQEGIIHGAEKQNIYIIDDAAGLTPNNIKYAFTIGDRKDFGGLNVFGIGMKRAAYWWTDKFYFYSNIGGATKPYEVLNKITNSGAKVNNLKLGEFSIKRAKLSDKFNGGRETGSIVKLESDKSFKEANSGYIYREINETEFRKICGALSTKYSDYLNERGYKSPAGKIIKINIYITFSKIDKEPIEKKLLSDEESKYYLKPLLMEYWPEYNVLPSGPGTKESWEESFTVNYKVNREGISKEVPITMKLYIQSEQKESTATFAHVYRGKKLQFFRFGLDSAQIGKFEFDGQSERPNAIVGQVGSRPAKYIRAEIDFTNVGKSEKGTSVNINKEELEEIYRILGREFKKSKIGIMADNFSPKLHKAANMPTVIPKTRTNNQIISNSNKKQPSIDGKVTISDLYESIVAGKEVYIESNIKKKKISILFDSNIAGDFDVDISEYIIKLSFNQNLKERLNKDYLLLYINVLMVFVDNCNSLDATSLKNLYNLFEKSIILK